MNLTPAQKLEGMVLDTGWKVLEAVQRSSESTGGHFSHGYLVSGPDGKRGFLKALDFTKALSTPDPATVLKRMTEAYVFERDLCKTCRDRHLRRVVIAIDDGTIQVDSMAVQYLIFELAEGDVRTYMRFHNQFDLAWTLRTVHHVATGLNQLHSVGIAHQDLKPSNVLVFGEESKVADLGRASSKQNSSPHDDCKIAGDMSYAPPELLYGYISSDWNQRRFGCDAYHLGSLIVFFFSGVHMTAMLAKAIVPAYHWKQFGGNYEEALPYVREAFGQACQTIKMDFPQSIGAQLHEMIQQLCEPDPRLRGHPSIRQPGRNQYSLERYISKLDLLAKKAEYGLLGR